MLAILPFVLAFASLPRQAEPELLPPAPDGWRFERLDFPLSFAPDLDHEGFEELYFAPGMFTPDSESFWSYVLAIRIEEDLVADEPFLRNLLERYYRGLCESVSSSQGRDLDLSGFAVELERSRTGFVAVIRLVDAFVTGEPLVLRVELEVHAGARTTELFGAASPQPADAAVWSELRGLSDEWRAARDASVFLNHIYVVPDPETYAALRDSSFLREEFAVSEQRTTERRDTTYTGVYFYGRNTYFEFLEPDAAAGFAAGGTGLAFGFEQAGATERAAVSLREQGITTFPGTISRAYAGEQVPWFEIMGIERPTTTSTLSLFTLEYVPEFLERWHTDREPAHGGILRSAVMSRYAASLERSHADALFQDVVEVHLALDEKELERVSDVCRSFGYVVTDRAGGGRLCDGPQLELLLSPSATPGGIRSFVVRLAKAVERAPLRLGKAKVVFAGERATFTFTE